MLRAEHTRAGQPVHEDQASRVYSPREKKNKVFLNALAEVMKNQKGATTLKGYKGMTKEMTCHGMKFEVGKTYRVDGEIKICHNGLHFCTSLLNVFNYYGADDSRFFEVETKQPVFSECDKSVTSELTIIREISNVEVSRYRYGVGYGNGRVGISEDDIVQTLSGQMETGGGNVPMVISIDRAAFNQGMNAQYDIGIDENGVAFTEVARGPGAVAYDETVYWSGSDVTDTLTKNNAGGNQRMPNKQNFNCVINKSGNQYTVRRLTPLECERLQGFPDGWTDIAPWTDEKGKTHKDSDSARYMALGNSIALPPWVYVLKNLTLACGVDVTMGSLFDGIGGFPLIWEWLNGTGSCLWASEIEEFPIAVTKQHFGDAVSQTTTATQQEATDDFKS